MTHRSGAGWVPSFGSELLERELTELCGGVEDPQDALCAASVDEHLVSSHEKHPLHRSRQESTNIEEVRKAGGVYVKRRANGRMVTHTILPRILKSDIRRSYPQMICNIDNINDPRLLLDFLNTVSLPSVVFRTVAHQCVQGSCEARTLTITGADQYVEFWKQLGALTPDKASRLLSSRVLARSDGTGEVHCVVELRGTMLVTRDDPTPWRHIGLDVDEFFGSPEVVGWIAGSDRGPAQAPPARLITIVVALTATLILDSLNRILRAEMSQGVPCFSEVVAGFGAPSPLAVRGR